MLLDFEIVNSYAPETTCDHLLYTPADSPMTARRSRVYSFDADGDPQALRRFVQQVLADEVSDQIHEGDQPAITPHAFYLDIGFKPGCLDLEKEYILRFFHELPDPGFSLNDLRIRQRTYLIGNIDVPPERFVHDLVNPVIHAWDVHYA